MPTSKSVSDVLLIATIALAMAIGGPVRARGQGLADDKGGDTASPEVDLDARQATVVIDGEPLFVVRGVSAYPAARRARLLEDRIKGLAVNRANAAPVLRVDDQPRATWILINGQRAMAVYDEDAELEAMDRHLLAQVYAARIADTIAAYRRARQPSVLWRHAFFVLLATLALLGVAYLGRRAVDWLRTGIERRYGVRIRDVAIKEFRIVKAEHLRQWLSGFLRFIWALTVIALVFVYLQYTLALFPWTREAANRLFTVTLEPLEDIALGIVDTIPKVLFLAILFWATRYVLKLVGLFFRSVADGTVKLEKFDPDWALPTLRIVRLFVVALAMVIAYPYVPGSDTNAFKGVSLLIGVVVSLGSSSLIGNLIAGYSITYRRAFKMGDWVKIGNYIGEVDEVHLFGTHLRTPKNEKVTVPNSSIVGSEVVNFSSMARDRGLVLHTTVGIGYETPWRQVEAMLLEAAARTPGLLRDPPPYVHEIELATFDVTYEINAYCDSPERMRHLYTELHRNILDLFNEYGVQIMTPAYEGDPQAPKIVARDQWYAPPAHPPRRAVASGDSP